MQFRPRPSRGPAAHRRRYDGQAPSGRRATRVVRWRRVGDHRERFGNGASVPRRLHARRMPARLERAAASHQVPVSRWSIRHERTCSLRPTTGAAHRATRSGRARGDLHRPLIDRGWSASQRPGRPRLPNAESTESSAGGSVPHVGGGIVGREGAGGFGGSTLSPGSGPSWIRSDSFTRPPGRARRII